MLDRRTQIGVGLAALLAAGLLLLVVIPFGVSVPSNVAKLVLSPVFWPNILAGLTAVTGLGLIATAWTQRPSPHGARRFAPEGGLPRLLLMAGLMVLYMLALGWLGMIWTSMLAFAAVAVLIRTRHLVTALVCAVLVPLVLYAFFAHVAGVAIPQSDFLRLP